MNSVYVSTKSPPKIISHQEIVLAPPTFVEEVRACFKKKGGSAILGPNYLRAIAEEIGRRYDRSFNAYRNVVPHDYMGRYCASDEEVALVVHEMFQARYPTIYQRYYETVIKERSLDIKVIYFTGDEQDESVFFRLGIGKIDLSEAGAHLTVEKPVEERKPSVEQVVDRLKIMEEVKIDRSEPEQPKPDPEVSEALDLLVEMVELEEKPAPLPKPEKPSNNHRRNREQKTSSQPVDK